jgi:murein DD-endopeptidase MepM/ murein hydrolase activator NlpD
VDRSPTALLLAAVLLVSGCSDYTEVRWGEGTSWAEAKQRAREAARRDAADRDAASARERVAQAQAVPRPRPSSGTSVRPEPPAGVEPAAGGVALGAWLDGMVAWLLGPGTGATVSSDTLVSDSAERQRIRAAASSEPPPLSGRGFLWPAQGEVIARFGELPDGTRNDGINIAAPERSDVVAAENGVVAYAGDEIAGYGHLILIRHADGFTTAYAHNEAVLVRVGEVVRRGQPIARVGRTGAVAAAQLHFEIRQGETPLDPSILLSGGGRAVAELGTPSG